MSTPEIKTRIGLDGEKSYKQGVADINSELKVLRSEMANVSASFDKNKQSVESLTSKNTVLNKQLEEQKKKVAEMRTALDNAKTSFGEADKRTREWEKSLNYAEAALKKTEAEIRANEAAINKLNNANLEKLKKSLASAFETLTSIGTKLTVGVTVPLVAAGAAAVKYSSDTQESLNKVEVAFGSAAESVKTWSDDTLNSIGLAKGSALDAAALFGDMATSMGYSESSAADMSIQLVELAADLASFKNISISAAQTALKSIFTGETESLKNLGVVMTEANLKSYALAEGIQTSYSQMTQAEKVALRYQYVLSATTNAQGDFARTSDSTANQLRITRESLKELAATAGDELLPIITPIIAQFNELLQSFGALDDETKNLIVKAALFAAALGPLMTVTGVTAKAIGTCVAAYGALKTALAAKVAADTAATASQAALNTAMNLNPAMAIATAVGVLVSVLGSLAIASALTAEKQETLNDKIQDTQSAYESAADAIADDLTAKQGELAVIEQLLPRMEELNNNTNRTAGEQAALNSLVEQANEIYPGLIGSVNEITGYYDINSAAIYRNIDAMKANYQVEANEELIREKYKTMAELNQQRLEAEAQLADLQSQYDEIMSQFSKGEISDLEATGSLGALSGQIGTLSSSMQKVAEQSTKLQAEADALIETNSGLYESMGNSTNATNGLGSALDQTAGATESQTKATKDLAETLGSATAEFDALTVMLEKVNSGYVFSQGEIAELIVKYPSLISAIQQVAGGYTIEQDALASLLKTQGTDTQSFIANEITKTQLTLQAIQKRIDGYKAEAQAIDALNKAANATQLGEIETARAEQRYLRGTGDVQSVMDNAQSYLDSLLVQAADISTTTSKYSGSSGKSSSAASAKTQAEQDLESYKKRKSELDFERDMEEISTQEYYDRLKGVADQYLTENTDEWRSSMLSLQKLQEEIQADAAETKQKSYEEELADLKYWLDLDLISESEYYSTLEKLRDEYLEGNSAAWRSATVEIYQWQEKQRDAAQEAEQDAYEEKQKALENAIQDEVDARKAQIKKELELEKERLNNIIDNIDDEIAARKRLREEKSSEDAVAAAKKALEAVQAEYTFARTDEDRAELAKEVYRLQKSYNEAVRDNEDTRWYNQKEAEKETVRDQIEALEKNADGAINQAESQVRSEYAKREADSASASAAAEMAKDQKNALTYLSVASDAAAALADAIDKAGSASAYQAMAQAVNSVTNNASANVTINTLSQLTTGQIALAVRKTLEQLGR